MSEHSFTRLTSHTPPTGLSKDVAAAFKVAYPTDGKTFRVHVSVESVFKFDDDLTASDITILNDAVAGYSNLPYLKDQRKAKIDTRTRELIDIAQTTGEGVVATITSAAVTLRASLDAARDQGEIDAVKDTR